MGTILLTSAGFRFEAPRLAFEKALHALGKNPRIVYIPSGIPGKQRKLEELESYLFTLSSDVTALDLHVQSADSIRASDVCIVGGGSPYVLLNLLRKKGPLLFTKFLNEGKLLVGMSGGAMILGHDVAITPLINPTIPKPKDFDFEALGLFPQNVFPHFNRYDEGLYEDRQEAVDLWLKTHEHFAIRDEECVVLKV